MISVQLCFPTEFCNTYSETKSNYNMSVMDRYDQPWTDNLGPLSTLVLTRLIQEVKSSNKSPVGIDGDLVPVHQRPIVNLDSSG